MSKNNLSEISDLDSQMNELFLADVKALFEHSWETSINNPESPNYLNWDGSGKESRYIHGIKGHLYVSSLPEIPKSFEIDGVKYTRTKLGCGQRVTWVSFCIPQ